MATARALQHAREQPAFDLARSIRGATRSVGKGAVAQAAEIWRLRFGPGRLQPDEYYAFRLYDDALPFEEKARFMGRAMQTPLCLRVSRVEWFGIAHDKLATYALLQGLGLPVPETRALYSARRRFGAVPTMTEPAALAAFLRREATYPLFGKPATGMRSVAVAALARYDAEADALILRDGRALAVDSFVAELAAYRIDGYLFQEMLSPHPAIADLIGGRLSTVRLIVTLEGGEPSVLHALWKVPVGDNPADNFWRPGNLLAALDPEDGRVMRIIQGAGPDLEEVERHPNTHRVLNGVTLPDWTAAVNHTFEGATALPGLGLQAWDVALTDRGPVLVEVNIGGDFNLPQLATGKGLMDERLKAFVASGGARGG